MLIQSADTLLRAINVALWLVVVVRFSPAAWRSIFGKTARPNDPLLAKSFFTGLIMIGGGMWWWIGSGNMATHAGIYALCSLLAVYAFVVGRAYDRA